MGSNSSSITLNTGAPKVCLLRPLLFTLQQWWQNSLQEGGRTTSGFVWRQQPFSLLSTRLKRLLSSGGGRTPLQYMSKAPPLRVSHITFLVISIPCDQHHDLSSSFNSNKLAKRAQQRMYYPRELKQARLPPPIHTTFYRGILQVYSSGMGTVMQTITRPCKRQR